MASRTGVRRDPAAKIGQRVFRYAKTNALHPCVSLRVRHAEDKRIQTIKAENNGALDAVGRDEWEHEITSDRPDLTRAKGTALAKLATKRLKRKQAAPGIRNSDRAHGDTGALQGRAARAGD